MAGDDRPRRPRRRPGENRERLIAAGISEFGTRGYHGASTAAIAAAAGVPQPHVYASFSTKRELFLACVGRACEAAIADRGLLPDPLAGMILHGVAASRENELAPSLGALLAELRDGIGERAFAALLQQAAKAQLAVDPEL